MENSTPVPTTARKRKLPSFMTAAPATPEEDADAQITDKAVQRDSTVLPTTKTVVQRKAPRKQLRQSKLPLKQRPPAEQEHQHRQACRLSDQLTSSQRAVLGMSDADLVKECQDILLGAMVGTAVPDIAATIAEGAGAPLQSSQQDQKQDTTRSEAAIIIQPAAAAVDIMDMETQLLEDLPQAMVTGGMDCSTQLGSFAFPIQQLAGPVDSAKAPISSAIPQAAAGDHAQCDSQSQTAKGEDVKQQQGSGSSQFMLSDPSSLPNMQSVAQLEQHILKAPAYENEQPERHLAEQAAEPIPAPAVESATPVPKAGKDGSSMNSLLQAMLAGDF